MKKARVFFLCLAAVPTMAASEHDAKLESKAVELEGAEAVFSNRIHSSSIDLGLAGGKASTSVVYYGSETYRVGAFGISKTIRFGEQVRITPAFNAMSVKSEEGLKAALPGEAHTGEPKKELHPYRPIELGWSVRWKAEFGGEMLGIVSEGNFLQSVLTTNGRRNFYTDGSHVSLKFGRLEGGVTAALANHGEEQERKYGVRTGIKLHKNLGVIGMLLWHGKPDVRAGISYSR